MWARVKGKTENDLAKLPFKNVFSFVRAYQADQRITHAFTLAKPQAHCIRFELLFPRYVCTLEDVGRAMIRAAADGYSKT